LGEQLPHGDLLSVRVDAGHVVAVEAIPALRARQGCDDAEDREE
jgi:hypothetical protein